MVLQALRTVGTIRVMVRKSSLSTALTSADYVIDTRILVLQVFRSLYTVAVDTVDVSQTLYLEPPAQRELDTRDLLNRRVGTPKSCGEAHLAQLVEDHPPIQEPLQDDRQRIVGLMLPASVV
jgi:hypothetical protein